MKEIACVKCGKKELFSDFMPEEKHLCDDCSRIYMEELRTDIEIEKRIEQEYTEYLLGL